MRQRPRPEDIETGHFAAPIGLISVIVAAATIAAVTLFLVAQHRASPLSAGEQTVSIAVGDIWFCDDSYVGGVCETTINVGDTVSWDFSGAALTHTTTECGASCETPTVPGLWDSGWIDDGSTYPVLFDEPGTFLYYCQVHPFAQLGRVVVGGGPPPTSTPTQPAPPPTSTPTQPAPVPTATPTGLAGDANCDESVTSVDSLVILQLVAGLLNSLSCEDNGDVNGDAVTNAVDSALILQWVAGLIPELPA